MGVSIGQAKQQFAVIVEGLHKDSGLLSQFAVWLDLKLSEYKLQGGMRLDSHEVVSHPDWMQGVKCRCLQNVASRMQKMSDSGFGNTAWMFPLIDQDGMTNKHYVTGQSPEVEPNAVHHVRRPASDLRGGDLDRSNLVDTPPQGIVNSRQKRDDRNLFQSAAGSLAKNSKTQAESTASTFLSSLAIAASIEKPNEASPQAGMALPVRPMGSSPMPEVIENGENPETSINYDIDYTVESRSDEEGNEVNDTLEDEYMEDIEEEDEKMPRIISVTSVEPDTPICYPIGYRPSQKGKRRQSYQSYQFSKKTRIVRNYSREYKLRVVGHCLKHGNRSASITFDVPKTNVQRWTNRVTKSSPECGIPTKAGLGNELQKAEELLVAWVNETYNESGSPTITELQNMASSIFEDVHPSFEPAYVWILNFLYRYKLAKLVELPTDLENALGETIGETDDVY